MVYFDKEDVELFYDDDNALAEYVAAIFEGCTNVIWVRHDGLIYGLKGFEEGDGFGYCTYNPSDEDCKLVLAPGWEEVGDCEFESMIADEYYECQEEIYWADNIDVCGEAEQIGSDEFSIELDLNIDYIVKYM